MLITCADAIRQQVALPIEASRALLRSACRLANPHPPIVSMMLGMHARTLEVLQHLDVAAKGFLDALQAIPERQRDRRLADNIWSAANVASHLARTEGQVAAFLQRALRQALANRSLPVVSATGSVLASVDDVVVLDRTNALEAPEFAMPNFTMTAVVALPELERARARTRQVLLAGDGLDTTSIRRTHHVLGELNFEQWTRTKWY